METKRIFILLVMLALVMNMTGCTLVLTKPDATQSVSPAETQPTSPIETVPVDDPDISESEENTTPEFSESAYTNLLETYWTALTENWTLEQLAAKELSQLCLFENGGDGLASIGYAITDVTGEGVPELIVGSLSADTDKVIFDLYTVADGKIIQLCSSGERNRYYLSLLEDTGSACNLINLGSSGAGYSEWFSYSIGADKPGILTVNQAIKYDAKTDAENPWFMGWWNGEQVVYTPTHEDTANAVMDAAEANYYLPELTPFGE